MIKLYQKLIKQKEYVISKQLLRCSTSIGANVSEALDAFSKREFAYRMSIAKKEACESHYWLRLLKESNLTKCDIEEYIDDIERIIRILTSIVKTTKENLNNNQ
jgi:four helix bundle protein